MTAVSGYAQTLLSVKLAPEDQEEALHYIYEECGRLERLSRKMMKLLEPDLMTDVLINLIDNGIKASEPGDGSFCGRMTAALRCGILDAGFRRKSRKGYWNRFI